MVFLVARGPSNAFEFHGSNYEVIRINTGGGSSSEGGMSPLQLLGGDANDMGASRAYLGSGIKGRRTHGALMLSNFLFILPLGAVLARQLRSHWIKKEAVKGALFYSHIIMQVTGVVIATVGFVIAVKSFDVKLAEVSANHGKIGVAVLCALYSQLLMGFARPPATAPRRRLRLAWAVAHNLLGNISILLGAVNCAIGIILFGTASGESVVPWLCTFLGGIVLSMALTRFLDSLERHAVSSKLDKPPPNSQTESLVDGDDHMNDHHYDRGSDWRDEGLGAGGSRSDVGGSFKGGNVALTERALREHAAAAAAGGGGGAGDRVEHLHGKDAAAGGGFDDQHGARL